MRPISVLEPARGVEITNDRDEQALPNEERIGIFIEGCKKLQHARQMGILLERTMIA